MNTLTEPSISQIESEVLRTGFGPGYCREKLLARATAEAERLNAVAPDAAREIERKRCLADEARAAADQVREGSNAAIATLQGKLVARGKHLSATEQLRALGADGIDAVAVRTLDAFFAALQSPCPQNSSAWEANLQWLAQLTALKPHLPQRLAAPDVEANRLLAEIRSIAKGAKIRVGDVVGHMRQECQELIDGRPRDPELHQLFAGGFMDVDDKT
jgi:hypothetical protein